MPDPTEEELGEYFDYLWHDTSGFVYLPTQENPADPRSWRKNAYEWPRQRAAVIRFALRKSAEGANVFASPALYNDPRSAGQRNSVLGTWTLWLDFDGTAPDTWDDLPVPEPDWKMQSSLPGHQHVYWSLNEFLTDTEMIEDRTRALAYSLKADTSGWDANQILRPVGTMNYPDPNGKKNRGPMVVHVLDRLYRSYSVDDFGAVTSAKQLVSNIIFEGEIPKIEEVIALKQWPAEMWELFNKTKEDLVGDQRGGRSAALQRLGYYGAEQGFSDEQILAVLQNADSRWEKYFTRRDGQRHLIDIINRARQKHGYLAAGDLNFAGLMAGIPVEERGEEQQVYGFSEFVEADFPIDWQLEGLLAQGGVGLVVGFPGTGKTQFAIQLGASISLGLEKFLAWDNMTGAKKVLFLSLEMSAAPLHLFMSTISPEYDDQHTLNQNFKVLPHGNPLPLDLEGGRSYLNSVLSEHQPDLVIIDSLQRIMSKEMTDELAVKEAMSYLSAVRKRFGCSMLIVHHNRKKSAQDARKHVELSDMYGSTFIAADVDFVVNLTKQSDQQLSVDMLKSRLGKETDRFDITRNEHLTYSVLDLNMATFTQPKDDDGLQI